MMSTGIRYILWALLLIGIVAAVVCRDEIGTWMMAELAGGSLSQLQQLLK